MDAQHIECYTDNHNPYCCQPYFHCYIYFFQNSVEQNLNTTSSELSLVFSGFQSDSSTSFTASARDYVENFDKKEEMEVLVINSSGRVVMTSTGFTPR